MALKILLLAALPLGAVQGPAEALQTAPELRDLARAARTASFRYESLQRRLAPTTNESGRGGRCDERIGRFCMWYDAPSDRPDPPPPPEPEEVAEARIVAVRAHRQWFAAEPSHHEAAGFLVRYLVEDDRAAEAVAAARTHAWAAGRDPDALLILGLALHYAADFAAAEAVFDSARAGMTAERRRRLDDVRVLLERSERGRYADLADPAKAAYERRLWALSDPSLLEAGNERRSGHYARHAWARIHERAPRVRGKVSWGSDLEEILLRFGLPVSRKRMRDFYPTLTMEDPRFIESFDPRSVALVPPALLTRGLPEAPPPGVRHDLVRDTAPSSYAPVRLRLAALDVVPTRVPAGRASVLRVDAALPPDTIPPGVPQEPRGLLAILDTLGNEVARVATTVRPRADSMTILMAEAPVPPGVWLYRVEVLDDATDLAGLAQYRITIPETPPALAGSAALDLSDLLVAHPFGDTLPAGFDDPRLQAHAPLVLPTGSRVGLFAEAHGLRREGRYVVEWWVEPEDEGTLLGRAARWLGRRLGLVEREEPLRIRWEDVAVGGVAPVAVNMDLSDADAGLYRIGLRVTDRTTGESRTADRLLRLADAPRSPARY